MIIKFEYDNGYGRIYPVKAHISAKLEVIEIEGCEGTSDKIYKCIEEQALELADEMLEAMRHDLKDLLE